MPSFHEKNYPLNVEVVERKNMLIFLDLPILQYVKYNN
jgi:hypothetical protein